MSQIVFFLEEPSAQAMLEGFLPKIIPAQQKLVYCVFQGKQDLERQLVRKLRGYLVPDAKFVILRDQDAADCRKVKQALTDLCRQSGRENCLVRIACHELESWYLGDLDAVEAALETPGLARRRNQAAFRDPDAVAEPARRLTRLVASYQKVSGSREIGRRLDPVRNRSRSFQVFVSGIRRLAGVGP